MLNWQNYDVGVHRIACPACGRGHKDKTLGMTVEADSAVAHCFRCEYVESFRAEQAAVRRAPTIKPLATATQKYETLSDWGVNLWRECQPISGIALLYLQARRCWIPPVDSDLRWHPAVKHPSGHIGPALVGLVTDIHTRAMLSLHRTWITATGKANLETPRMPLAGHTLKNGVIRLTTDDQVNAVLGIAEGIETALSLGWCLPVWACIDAGHLSQFPVLAGITTLVIGQDQDPAGMTAARACSQRWADADRAVYVSQQQTNDLNDVLRLAA